MRRHLLAPATVVVLAGLWVAMQPGVPSAPAAPSAPTRRVEATFQSPSAPSAPESPALVARTPDWDRAIDSVESACGLAVERWCDPSGCAVVLEAPDLDQPLGWLEMAFERPRFVGNVVGRELGLGALPCGTALSSAFADGIRVVEPLGEREVWCVSEADAGLCDRAAAAVLGREVAFGSSDRRLRFTR